MLHVPRPRCSPFPGCKAAGLSVVLPCADVHPQHHCGAHSGNVCKVTFHPRPSPHLLPVCLLKGWFCVLLTEHAGSRPPCSSPSLCGSYDAGSCTQSPAQTPLTLSNAALLPSRGTMSCSALMPTDLHAQCPLEAPVTAREGAEDSSLSFFFTFYLEKNVKGEASALWIRLAHLVEKFL